jgi:hypothetical protein
MIFPWPTQVIVSGPTMSGKSQAVMEILRRRNELFDRRIDDIIYYYSCWDPAFEEFTSYVSFVQGEVQDVEENTRAKLIIADDQILSKQSVSKLTEIFLVQSHHRNATIFCLSQFLFSKNMRPISINAKAFIIFASLRDRSNAKALFQQADYPTDFLAAIYKAATQKSHSFLCMNLDKRVPPLLRFSTNDFGKHPIYFVRSGTYKGKPIPVTWPNERENE